MTKPSLISLLITTIILASCAAKKPYVRDTHSTIESTSLLQDNIDYELFLVGDVGATTNKIEQADIVTLIKSEIVKSNTDKSIVFLGNSFSETGFPDEETSEFTQLDSATKQCIRELKDHTDKVYFIPGNTEWYDGHDYTVSALQHVEEYVERAVGGKNVFVPSDGCGQPKVVELTDDLLLVLIDSQWVLQGDRSGERKKSGCDIDDELEMVTFIQEVLAKNKNKNVVIAAHHPVHSNGKTGGNYGAKSHLLPLPIIGSLLTGIKKLNGGQQKFGHPQYESYRAAMNLALGNYEGIIHVSAHDKNLQYHDIDDNHFLVAGSGADVDFVRKGGTADFALMKQGFSKITHTKDFELWLEFYVPDENNHGKAKSVYKKRLYKKEVNDYTNKDVYKDIASLPKTKTIKASTNYRKGKLGMGKTYRKTWEADVEVPLLLLDDVHGGLKPIKQGGGFQTKSLRLENSEGQQWVARSVDKHVFKVVPHALRQTFISGFVQDGISASHPYGAMVVPPFAEAVGVYHANPKYVWIPAQEALGEYNNDFAEDLYLFEERPGGNMKNHPNYGGAKESINTPELINKLYKNHHHTIDQEYIVKARLLDLLLGDWDRHDDQWRWGIYEDEQNNDIKIYRPIPRDRDQVFFKNDGFLQYIASRPFVNPALRKFDDEIDFISGLAFNARHFDRHFLSEMNEEVFIKAAQFIQSMITDELISDALHLWPEAVYEADGKDVESKIKSRRQDLVKYAKEYYRYLTKEVTAIGTNGKNTFDVKTLQNDKLDVKVYHHHKNEKHLIWSRTINGKDCDELRLFGLKKGDSFNFFGNDKSSIKIRLVGGSGDDIVNNSSESLSIITYDRPEGMALIGNKVKSILKDNQGINSFDRKDWKLDRYIHFPMISFYTDEGIGIGYNVLWKKNGFRKNPYKANHSINVNYFFANSAFVGRYAGHWPSVFGPNWDFRLEAAFSGPTFTQYFYGLGNEYINYEEVFLDNPEAGSPTFHIVRGIHLDINPHFEYDIGNKSKFSINPTLEFLNLDDELNDPNEARFIFEDEANRTSLDFENKIYTGLGLLYTTNRVNSATLPTRGYVLNLQADYRQSLTNSEFSHVTFSTNVAAYIPFSPTHRVVLATNIGGAYTFGDYEFFHANFLSNQSRLRGFKSNRFAGDGIVYHATDLRIKLIQGKGGLNSGYGLFGSFDYGRAFLEGENIDDWHTSFGGGLYLTPLNILGFKIGYYVGEDDTQLSIGGALSF